MTYRGEFLVVLPQEHCPLQCLCWLHSQVGPVHCPLFTTPLQLPPVIRRFSKRLWSEKKPACILFLLLLVLFPFLLPASSSKFVSFFSNGFVQLHDKSHPPKRQTSFLYMSPQKALLIVRVSQSLFNVKLYGFGGFPNSINPFDSTNTLSGVVRTELINCSVPW